MFNKLVHGFKNVCSTVGITYSLDNLRADLALAQSSNDPNHIIKYIKHIGSFWSADRQIAIELIRNTLWTQSEPNDYAYEFSKLFKSLTAANLIIVIQTMGNTDLQSFIFENNTEQMLAPYSMLDCFKLLKAFYFDSFALFVFYKFTFFINRNQMFREQFMSLVSMNVVAMILNENDGLTRSESLNIFFKLIKYIQSEPHFRLRSSLRTYGYIRRIQSEITSSQTIPESIYGLCSKYLDYQNVFAFICMNVLHNDDILQDASMKDEHLYFIFRHRLVPVDDFKYILTELKRRKAVRDNDLTRHQTYIAVNRQTCDSMMHVPSRRWTDKSDAVYVKDLQHHIEKINKKYQALLDSIDAANALQAKISYLSNVIQEIEGVCHQNVVKTLRELIKKL